MNTLCRFCCNHPVSLPFPWTFTSETACTLKPWTQPLFSVTSSGFGFWPLSYPTAQLSSGEWGSEHDEGFYFFRDFYDEKRSKWALIQYIFSAMGVADEACLMSSGALGRSEQEGEVTNNMEEQALESTVVEESGFPTGPQRGRTRKVRREGDERTLPSRVTYAPVRSPWYCGTQTLSGFLRSFTLFYYCLLISF